MARTFLSREALRHVLLPVSLVLTCTASASQEMGGKGFLSTHTTSTTTMREMSSTKQEWRDVGDLAQLTRTIGNSSSPDNYNGGPRWLALDGNGRPHACFLSSAFGYRPVVVAYDGSSWNVLGKPGFESEAPIMEAAIAIDSASGTPYVALLGDKQEVWTLEDGNWKALPFLGQPGSRANVVVHDGAPYTLVSGNYSLDNDDFQYDLVHYDTASKSWKSISPGKIHLKHVAMDMDLAISRSGTPFVAIQLDGDENYMDLIVMTLRQGAWVVVGQGVLAKTNDFSIAVDPISERPIIAFDEFESKQITVMAFDDTNWTALGGSGAVSEGFQAVYPMLSLSPKGTPMVAYGNWFSVGGHVKAWEHGEWKSVGGELAYYSSDNQNSMGFAIGSEGEPFVAYPGQEKGSINVARLV